VNESKKATKNALVLNPLRGKNEGVKPLWNYSLNQKSGTGMVSLIPFSPVFCISSVRNTLILLGFPNLSKAV
ncbi:MAG: hypothetical protein IJM80_02195, partial [Firmicutes bacterium]|nr:hypothetical protein [Bacillota bacterium]